MKAQQLIHLVLTLWKSGDVELLSELVSPAEQGLALRLVSFIERFDYSCSIEFDEMALGKSDAFVAALKRRFSEPAKRSEIRERFFESIRRMIGAPGIERYFPARYGPELTALRQDLLTLNDR